MSDSPAAAGGRGRPRKWRPLAVYWCVQAAAIYFLWPAILCTDLGELGGVPRMWWEPAFAGWTIVGIVLLTAGQLAFVLPVSPPRVGEGGLAARVLRHGAAGLAAGAMAGLTVGALLAGVELLTGDPLVPSDMVWPIMWTVFGAVSLIVAGVLLRRYRNGTPIGVSIAIAAGVAAALLLGAAAAGVELYEWMIGRDASEETYGAAMLVPVVVGGGAATPLLAAFVRRGPRETRLERLASRLFLGSVIEVVAVIPLDVMVRRRTNCYCGEGTFWSLVLCGSAGLLMLGPGMFFLLGRRRRRWLAGRCEVCEYDMSGCLDAARCPECGAGWGGVSGER